MTTDHLVVVAAHHHGLVTLSVVVSVLTAYAARELFERVRDARGRLWLAWVAGAAMVDGIGTWSMHYTGMLALQTPVPVTFDWRLVFLSYSVSVLGSAAALLVIGRGRIGWARAAGASVFLGGIGISGLHFTGMAAMVQPVPSHHSPLVMLSIALAIVFAMMSLAFTFVLWDHHRLSRLRYHAAAVSRGLANPVMHYTAMAGATFVVSSEAPDLSHAVSISSLGVLDFTIVPVVVLIVALLTAVVDRLRKQREALRESGEKLHALLEERQRLARDLHDHIVQAIYAVGMRLERLQRRSSPDIASDLKETIESLNQVIRDARQYISGGQPEIISEMQFRSELTRLFDTSTGRGALRFDVDLDSGAFARLGLHEAEHVLHIAREALSNALRHSHARHGTFALYMTARGARLEISDAGVGFNRAELRHSGSGLQNMESRARQIGGRFQIESAPGRGTRVILDIPMPEHRGGEGPSALSQVL